MIVRRAFWLALLTLGLVFFASQPSSFLTDLLHRLQNVPQARQAQSPPPSPARPSLHAAALPSGPPTPAAAAGGHRTPAPTVRPAPPPTPRPTSPPTPAPANCNVPSGIANNLSQLVAAVRQKYGVILGGNALSLDKAQLTYETMCMAFESTAYQQNLNSLRQPVIVNFVWNGSCFAWTYASPPHTDMLEPCPTIVDKYVLIHELTHQMQMGGALGRNAHWAQWQAVWSVEQNHRIPTGPCVYEDPGDGGECEADAVAEYMFYKVYRNAWTNGPPGGPTLSTYPTQWPKWYNFARDDIFGGVTY